MWDGAGRLRPVHLKNPAALGPLAGSRQWRRWAALTEVQVSNRNSAKRNAANTKAHPITEPALSSSLQEPRAGSKQALVIQLLSRPEGASLNNLVQATGWLPHTVRAALTGLRQRGFEIERLAGEDGRSVYRLRGPEPEAPTPAGAAARPRPTHARALERHARHASAVARSHQTASPEARVETELARLASADLTSLRRRWRALVGGAAPNLPRALLSRVLAYRIQADAFGGLHPARARLLDELGRGQITDIPLPL